MLQRKYNPTNLEPTIVAESRSPLWTENLCQFVQ